MDGLHSAGAGSLPIGVAEAQRDRTATIAPASLDGERLVPEHGAAEANLHVERLGWTVEQEGKGACHTGEYSCFFRDFGDQPES